MSVFPFCSTLNNIEVQVLILCVHCVDMCWSKTYQNIFVMLSSIPLRLFLPPLSLIFMSTVCGVQLVSFESDRWEVTKAMITPRCCQMHPPKWLHSLAHLERPNQSLYWGQGSWRRPSKVSSFIVVDHLAPSVRITLGWYPVLAPTGIATFNLSICNNGWCRRPFCNCVASIDF